MTTRYEHTKDESRIRAAMSTMPFGGTETVSARARAVGLVNGAPTPIRLSDIGAYLEALASVLGEIAERTTADRKLLTQLEADILAVRRVFGT